MIYTLLIQKKANGTFWHIHNGDVINRFNISDFEVDIDGMKFNIVEKDGATRFTYLIPNITVQDLGGTSEIENFNSPEQLRNRLAALAYTPYVRDVLDDAPFDGQIYGRQDGAWVLVQGGSGSSPIYQENYKTWNTGNPLSFVMAELQHPELTPMIVFQNNAKLRRNIHWTFEAGVVTLLETFDIYDGDLFEFTGSINNNPII